MNLLGLCDLPAITSDGLIQGGGFARRGEQSLNEPPGFFDIKLNPVVLMDNLESHFTDMGNYKFSHRASLNRSRFLEKLFVRLRHACDESPAFLFFCCHLHILNVCLRGTHCKN